MNVRAFPYDRAVSGVCDLRPYQPGKPIEEVERELGVPNAIKLASNENPLGPSPLVLAAMRECLDRIALYPDANGFRLKAALADRLAVQPEQITLGNGSNDVLDIIARVFVAPQDEVVFSKYAFLVYALVTQAVCGRAVVSPASGWGHDLAAMAEHISNATKVVYIANPNNPTGTYNSAEQFADFLANIPTEVVVVLDEAYTEYVDAPDYPNGLDFLDRHPNLVVTRTFSKAYGLAGLRIGYAVASKEITDLLNRVRQPFNVGQVAQTAAIAALEDPDHISRSLKINRENMRRLQSACEELGLRYIPSVANFLTIEFGPQALEVQQRLMQHGIIVRPVDNYDMPQHLRVTIGRAAEMDQFVEAIKTVI